MPSVRISLCLKQAEDRGTVFKDNNQPKPGLQIFKDHGYNWIRLQETRLQVSTGLSLFRYLGRSRQAVSS